jgi:alkanesulfonate monooxygenase SsuD/methylene tetrahydromethanopterin reductase-like flavin-dependent oxidoreductase (luciferase family)
VRKPPRAAAGRRSSALEARGGAAGHPRLVREGVASFGGRYYQVSGAHNVPRPVQTGGPPILVAGSGERRLLRPVAQYADQCNLSFPSGDHLASVPHKLEVLAAHCETVGRDPAEITRTYKGLLVVDRCESRAQRVWAS